MNYVIAATGSWSHILVNRLHKRTGENFCLIDCKDDLSTERLAALAPRYVFFLSWPYRVTATIHQEWECVIFHMPDLPYACGSNPLQSLNRCGFRQTQLMAMRCVAELDAGPIYLKRVLYLDGSAFEIFMHATHVIEDMIETIIHEIPEPQRQQGDTDIARCRRPADRGLNNDPTQDLNNFFDFIRILEIESCQGACSDLYGHRVEISRRDLEHDRQVSSLILSRHSDIPGGNSGESRKMIKTLLDDCYPKPPRDVYNRLVKLYRRGDPFYTIESSEQTVAMVYCVKHSKGGHLESLAVHPDYRGLGLSDWLVQTLIGDNPGVISLTTRIPRYFERLGFQPVRALPDQSVYMIQTTITH